MWLTYCRKIRPARGGQRNELGKDISWIHLNFDQRKLSTLVSRSHSHLSGWSKDKLAPLGVTNFALDQRQ